MIYPGRDRDADLMLLANAFFDNLERGGCEYGGWGLDDKRPFGNKDVEGDIIDIIGLKVNRCPHCNEPLPGESSGVDPRVYAANLYQDLGKYVRDKWNEAWR